MCYINFLKTIQNFKNDASGSYDNTGEDLEDKAF